MGKYLPIEALGAHESLRLMSTLFVLDGIEGELAAWIPVRGEEFPDKWTLFLELTFVERDSVGVRIADDHIHVRAALLGDFWKPGLNGFSRHHGELRIPLLANANPATVRAHHFKDLLTIEVEKINRRKERSVFVSHSWSKPDTKN